MVARYQGLLQFIVQLMLVLNFKSRDLIQFLSVTNGGKTCGEVKLLLRAKHTKMEL